MSCDVKLLFTINFMIQYILNSLHPDIKFTKEFSNEEKSVLDVMVKKEKGHIETDRYYKETDSKQFLLFDS